ncbi:hypothetical protein ACQ4PT_062356 [Festuca glaucescens]
MVVQPRRAPTTAARAPARGATPWTDVRGRKRARNQQATLPAWTIRSGLPTNLAGACFNCTRTCHISAECTYETVCLRCGEEGHHARACPQNRRAGGDRHGERGLGPVAPSGLPAHQRLGPRELEPATAAGRNSSPPRAHGRDPPAPPPVREAAGSSSHPPVRGRSPGASSRGRGDAAGERPRDARDAHGSGSADRYPRPAEDARIRGGRSSSRPRQDSSARGAVVDRVFVPRTDEIIVVEAVLRSALVAFVSGKRAYVTLSEAGAALAERVPRAADNFTVHRSWPAGFLFVYSSRRVRDEVMAADAAHGRDFSLRFSPWNRQLQAMQCRLRYRAHFELQGVPAHAWNRTTATAVLSSDAWVECLGTLTANREDLWLFRVVAWTNDLSVFPKAMEMLIEEPDDRMVEDEGLVLPGAALIPLEKNMLRYQITVRVAHAEDMIPVEEEDDDRRDDGAGGDGGGLSDRDDGHGRSRPHDNDGCQEERGRGCGRDDPRDQTRARRGDSLRRRPPGGGWGGSRRVAINTAMEVTPCPEVEDDDVERQSDAGADSRAAPLSEESSQALRGDRIGMGPPLGPLASALAVASLVSPRVGVGLVTQDIPGRSSPPVDPTSAAGALLAHDAAAHPALGPTKTGHCPLRCCHVAGWRRMIGRRGNAGPLAVLNLIQTGMIPTGLGLCGGKIASSLAMIYPRDVPGQCLASRQDPPTVRPMAVDPASQSLSVDFADFRSACRKPISPVLDMPSKKCRKKKTYASPVRHSGRICGRLVAGAPICQQQRMLMTRLGIAREGEVIGDDALDAYLDLFARPLRQQHLDVVLHLFGWTPADLLSSCDAPVECLT